MAENFLTRLINRVFGGGQKPGAAKREMPSVTESSGGAAPKTTAQQQARSAEKVAPDDLTAIKGIGPTTQQKLRSLGIRTMADLAGADAEELRKKLGGDQPLSESQVRKWIDAAKQQAG